MVEALTVILAAAGFWLLLKLLAGGAILAIFANVSSPLLLITIGIFVLWWFTRKKK